MNADLSPALAASNTVETLAPSVVYQTTDPNAVIPPHSGEVVQFVDKVETEAAKIEDAAEAEAKKALAESEALIREVIEKVEAVAEIVDKKVIEKIFHPEVGVTRPVLNHTVLTSTIKNPA